MTEVGMKIHSDKAWNIASGYSYCLASDTRTLAAQIDDLIEAETKSLRSRIKELEEALNRAELNFDLIARTSECNGVEVPKEIRFSADTAKDEARQALNPGKEGKSK